MLRRIVGAIIVSSCASTVLVAQVEKGDVELAFSGSLGWARSTVADFPSTDSWGVNGFVAAGFFISGRVDVGGQFGAGYSDFDNGHSYSFSLVPTANYHFRPRSDIVPFVGAGVGYMRRESESDLDASTSITTGWYAQVQGGADFFLNRFVSIKLLMRYDRTDGDLKSTGSFGSRSISAESEAVSTVVGLAFFFK